ncbi:heavy metal translocating P-type ATPase [Clostridium sp. CAG:356]|nr:heavy metal translocating P-type ATPase [Clostridium sp. CAG:356]
MKRYEFILKDLDCAACANEIQEKLAKNPELHNVNVNFAKLKLTYETDTVSVEEVRKAVKEQEPDVEMISAEKMKEIENKKESKMGAQIARLLIGIIIAGIGLYAKLPDTISTIFIILGYAILLYRTAKNAFKMLFASKKINENFLITVSCVGAYLVGEHMEGLMVIILYEIGKILEEKSISKSRKSIKDLMDIKPEYANLKTENDIKKVSPEEVKIGDTILIKEGEKVPLDGIVKKGTADLNTASLTGESKLTQVSESENVLSGSIVVDGMIEVKVTEEYKNSTVSRILDLVENATDKKAKIETFVNKASSIYTPIVIGLAAIVAIFLPLFTDIPYTGNNGSIYRALIFLVISCPCSIAISVPLSYFSGIGKSSKEGILIKGSDYIDAIKDIKEIVFDKTGTLTKGEFEITKIDTFENYTEQEVLKYAAMGEKYSNHPIAKSIMKANKEEVAEVQEFKEIAGKGLSYQYNGETVLVGNSVLVEANDTNEEGATKIYVKINDKLAGIIYLGDTVKDGVVETIKELKALGIKTNMFTGDNKQIAEKTGKEIGIQNIKSEMLPQDKYNAFEEIINKKDEKSKVAFVGDGINDSPVLARADVGISMGGVGSESAIEASDVVIMTDNVSKILDAIKISKKTCRIIRQNLVFAITVKVLILLLSTIGLSGMWQAVFADVGVTILTIFNTLRILK